MSSIRLIIKKRFPVIYGCAYAVASFFVKYQRQNFDMQQSRNIHCGKRCFIIGTGPSLVLDDLELLKDEICFGVNGCVRLFDKTAWRPKYYCMTDMAAFQLFDFQLCQYQDDIDCVFIPSCRVACTNLKKFVQFNTNVYPYRYHSKIKEKVHGYIPRSLRYYFGHDEKVFCDGATVLQTAMQIAVYMGFSEIYLLGADCDYTSGKQYSSALGDVQYITDVASERYMLESYEEFSSSIKRQNLPVKIYNVTRGGKLETFCRQKLEQVWKLEN